MTYTSLKVKSKVIEQAKKVALLRKPLGLNMGKIKLKKAFRVLGDLGYVGKFDSPDVAIGDVYTWDDGRWNYLESLSNDIDFEQYIRESKPADMKYIMDSAVEVKIGVSGAAGVAKGNIQLNFTKHKSAFIYLKDTVTRQLAVGEIAMELADVWNKKRYSRKKHAFCTEVVKAQSGSVIFSLKKDNSIEISAKNQGAELTEIANLASGDVKIVSSKSQYFEMISRNPFEPLYRAVNIVGTKNKPKFDWVK